MTTFMPGVIEIPFTMGNKVRNNYYSNVEYIDTYLAKTLIEIDESNSHPAPAFVIMYCIYIYSPHRLLTIHHFLVGVCLILQIFCRLLWVVLPNIAPSG